MLYILLAVLAAAAVMLWVLVRANKQNAAGQDQQGAGADGEEHHHEPVAACCGAHEVCEAESLLALSDKVVYYDDEELDVYRGTPSDAYSAAQTEEFRDVLLTLQTHEVAGWLRSLALRGVFPPDDVKEEALMIVDEFRDQRRRAAQH